MPERTPRTSNEISRREMLAYMGVAVVIGTVAGPKIAPVVAKYLSNTADKQRMDDLSAMATAAARSQNSLAGNGEQLLPPDILATVRQATGFMLVNPQAKPGEQAETKVGTFAVICADDGINDGSVFLLTVAHLMGDGSDIASITVGFPGLNGTATIPAAGFRLAIPDRYAREDNRFDRRGDLAVIRIPQGSVPDILGIVNPLTVDPTHQLTRGQSVAIAGYPQQFLNYGSLGNSALDIAVGPVLDADNGQYTVRCELDKGSSGAPAVGSNGTEYAVLAVNVASLNEFSDQETVVSVSAVPELIAAARSL